MQERVDQSVVTKGAQDGAASWYLLRDGEQHGPLTERELALFAKSANFKSGDLLWTAGLDGWKPATEIFGATPAAETSTPAEAEASETDRDKTDTAEAATGEPETDDFEPEFAPADEDTDASFALSDDAGDAVFEPAPEAAEAAPSLAPAAESEAIDAAFGVAAPHEAEAHDTAEPDGEDVTALVQALKGEKEPEKPTLKSRLVVEAKKFAGIFIYLWVVFLVLLVHEWIVLSENHIGFTFYGLAAINALILAKIMVIADSMRTTERLNRMPLVQAVLVKAVLFSTLLLVAYVLEAMLFGVITGHGVLASIPNVGGGFFGALGLWLIFSVALVPYFAYREIERVIGKTELRVLLLAPR